MNTISWCHNNSSPELLNQHFISYFLPFSRLFFFFFLCCSWVRIFHLPSTFSIPGILCSISHLFHPFCQDFVQLFRLEIKLKIYKSKSIKVQRLYKCAWLGLLGFRAPAWAWRCLRNTWMLDSVVPEVFSSLIWNLFQAQAGCCGTTQYTPTGFWVSWKEICQKQWKKVKLCRNLKLWSCCHLQGGTQIVRERPGRCGWVAEFQKKSRNLLRWELTPSESSSWQQRREQEFHWSCCEPLAVQSASLKREQKWREINRCAQSWECSGTREEQGCVYHTQHLSLDAQNQQLIRFGEADLHPFCGSFCSAEKMFSQSGFLP